MIRIDSLVAGLRAVRTQAHNELLHISEGVRGRRLIRLRFLCADSIICGTGAIAALHCDRLLALQLGQAGGEVGAVLIAPLNRSFERCDRGCLLGTLTILLLLIAAEHGLEFIDPTS